MNYEPMQCKWCGNDTYEESICMECQEIQETREERNKKKFNNDSLRPKKDKKPWKSKRSRACPNP